jgi:hypothetical protein
MVFTSALKARNFLKQWNRKNSFWPGINLPKMSNSQNFKKKKPILIAMLLKKTKRTPLFFSKKMNNPQLSRLGMKRNSSNQIRFHCLIKKILISKKQIIIKSLINKASEKSLSVKVIKNLKYLTKIFSKKLIEQKLVKKFQKKTRNILIYLIKFIIIRS